MTRSRAGIALASLLVAGAPQAAEPRRGEPFRDCATCPEMMLVPAGSFVMGTPSSQLPGRPGGAETETTVIRIARPFALGRYEVTRGEFSRFVADTGYESRPGCRTWDPALQRFNDDARRGWRDPATPAERLDSQPVTCVSHADAVAYARWLAAETRKPYRLPSEAEWEYAARAGTATLRPWGEDAEDGCEYANTYDVTSDAGYRLGWPYAGCRDGYPDVAPVGQFKPNAFGLHDMIGNVWEWVEDCATGSYLGRPRDGRAWTWLGGCRQRVQRGGGWSSPPNHSRSGYRGEADQTDRADFAGFRLAMDLDERTARGEDR